MNLPKATISLIEMLLSLDIELRYIRFAEVSLGRFRKTTSVLEKEPTVSETNPGV
jgi:hypothetical protein